MHKTALIFLLFFGSVSLTRAAKPGTRRKPFILTEYYDENTPLGRRYEYPSCAIKDETKHEIVFSASGEKFEIKYFCYPVRMETCAEASGTYLNNYCAFKKKPNCGVDGNYEYVMERVPYSEAGEVACDSLGDEAKLYRVGYDFYFVMGEPVRKEIYRFCFDKLGEKTVYAEYKIISPNLLSNPEVNDREFHEKIDTSSFDRNEFGDFSKKKAYFDKMAKKQNKDLASRNLVVPPSHMAMDWWKDPLFHIVNEQMLRPKFHTAMNWINDYIKNKAIEILGEVFIRTGVMDTFEFTYDSSIWWKLIYDERRKYAIAVFIHNWDLPPTERLCGKENTCFVYGWGKIVQSSIAEFMYCCNPKYLVDLYGFEPVETFDLASLPEEEYIGQKKGCQIPPGRGADSQDARSGHRPILKRDFSTPNTNSLIKVN